MRNIVRLLVAAIMLAGFALFPGASPASANVNAICDGVIREVPGGGLATATNGYLDASVINVHPGNGWNQHSFAIAVRGGDATSFTTYLRLDGSPNWTNYYWRMESPAGTIPAMAAGHAPGWAVTADWTYVLTLWNWGSDNHRWLSSDYNFNWTAWTWDAPINSGTWTATYPIRWYADYDYAGSNLALNIYQGAYYGGGLYRINYKCGFNWNGDHRTHG